MTWEEIRRDRRFKNRWVALDHCEYAESGLEPKEADVVDADPDLGELCTRLNESDRSHCAIVFCPEPELIASLVERRRFARAS